MRAADQFSETVAKSMHWFFDWPIAIFCTVVGLLSVGILLLWNEWFDPILAAKLPTAKASQWHWVVLTGVLFASINATLEELCFREILFQPLRRICSPFSKLLKARISATLLANAIQALLFGVMHWGSQSVPHGFSGFVLTAAFGFVLGAARVIFQGLAAPIWIHIIADLGVFFLLVSNA